MDEPRSRHLGSLRASLDYLGEKEILVDLLLRSGRTLKYIYIVKIGEEILLGDRTSRAPGEHADSDSFMGVTDGKLVYFYVPLASIESVQSSDPIDGNDTDAIDIGEMNE